jgi:hypothetical protein
VRLVSIPLREQEFPLCRPASWLGSKTDVVDTAYASNANCIQGLDIEYFHTSRLSSLSAFAEQTRKSSRYGRVATRRDCGRAAREISRLLGTLGLTRQLAMGELSCSTRVEHLGCIIYTKLMRFFITPRKIVRYTRWLAHYYDRKGKEVVGFLEK